MWGDISSKELDSKSSDKNIDSNTATYEEVNEAFFDSLLSMIESNMMMIFLISLQKRILSDNKQHHDCITFDSNVWSS